MRRRVKLVLIAQILIPAVLLGVRWNDPSVGQQRAGWQMHTACWGKDEPCKPQYLEP